MLDTFRVGNNAYNETYERNKMYSEIAKHQSQAEDRILQNWIATQQLAKDTPVFQPK